MAVKQLSIGDLQNTKRDFVKIAEITELLNLSARQIQSLCRDGKIGSTRSGKSYLIPPVSVLEYLNVRR